MLRRGQSPVIGGPGADVRLRLAAAFGEARDGDPALAGWEVDRGTAAAVRQSAQQLLGVLKRFEAEDDAVRADFAASGGGSADSPLTDTERTALLLGLAFPDRIGLAKGNSQQEGRYKLSGGREAHFHRPKEDPLAREKWIVVAELSGDSPGDRGSGRVYLAAPFPEPLLSRAPDFAPLFRESELVFWNPSAGAAQGRAVRSFGEIRLSEAPLPQPSPEAILSAVLEGLRGSLGLRALPWSKSLLSFRARVQFLRGSAAAAAAAGAASSGASAPTSPSGLVRGAEDLPDLSDVALLATLEHWLAPYLGGVARKDQLAAMDVDSAVRGLLTREQLRLVEEATPTHFETPAGSRVALDYEQAVRNGGVPVLSVKLQEMFGFEGRPSIAGVPLRLTLTDPGGKAIQVTSDLPGFWASPAYAATIKDMRRAYPKWEWPDDPRAANPTARTKKKTEQLLAQQQGGGGGGGGGGAAAAGAAAGSKGRGGGAAAAGADKKKTKRGR